ncbi:MAG: TraR/DksA family transcriptional regulator [Thiobacillus sp.]
MAALTPSQIDQLVTTLKKDYQTLLIEVRDELENKGVQHRIDLLNSEPGDSGDEAMANALADFNVTVVDRQVQGVRDIEATFKRIKDGGFGVCIDCGDTIPFNRLQAYPTAKRCIGCQEKREKQYAREGHPTM